MLELTPDELRMTIRTALFDHFSLPASAVGLSIGSVVISDSPTSDGSNWTVKLVVKSQLQSQADGILEMVKHQFPRVKRRPSR